MRDLIRSKTKNSDDYNEQCMKVKLNSEIPNMTVVVRAIFY